MEETSLILDGKRKALSMGLTTKKEIVLDNSEALMVYLLGNHDFEVSNNP